VALFDGDPLDGGTELTGFTNPRVATSLDNPSLGKLVNDVEVLFGSPTVNNTSATHAAIFSAASGGYMIAANELVRGKNLLITDVVKIPVGGFDITLTV
jgi:hypothetical protein